MFRPSIELLENRTLPAGLLILDFSPRFAPPFRSLFHGLSILLDVNNDRRANAADAQLMADQIAAQAAGLFARAGLACEVLAVDVLGDTGIEHDLVDQALAEHRPVQVIDIRADTSTLSPGSWGWAPHIAAPGFNEAGPAEVYAGTIRSIAKGWISATLRRGRVHRPNVRDIRASSSLLAVVIADVAVHEQLHLLGVEHVPSQGQGADIMGDQGIFPLSARWAYIGDSYIDEVRESLSGVQETLFPEPVAW